MLVKNARKLSHLDTYVLTRPENGENQEVAKLAQFRAVQYMIQNLLDQYKLSVFGQLFQESRKHLDRIILGAQWCILGAQTLERIGLCLQPGQRRPD